jgi:hypothetical protein
MIFDVVHRHWNEQTIYCVNNICGASQNGEGQGERGLCYWIHAWLTIQQYTHVGVLDGKLGK